MRRLVWDVLERLAVGIGLPALARPRSLVLAYHNVVPDDTRVLGERTLHLRFERFRAQLDELCETHRVVPLRDLVEGRRDSGEPLAAITFDDAYRGALGLAAPELTRRGLPATVFVAPGTLGTGAFWWDTIAAETTGTIDRAIREFALSELRGDTGTIHEWARQQGLAPREPDPGSWEQSGTVRELQDAVRDPLITVGSHGWSHANLTAVASEGLREELSRPLDWLKSHHRDRALPYLAYPYGLSSTAVTAATREAKYEAAFLVAGGALPNGDRPKYELPRINVPSGLSERGFRLLVSGVLSS